MPGSQSIAQQKTTCYHCGEDCDARPIVAHDKQFCCDGCKMVYEIINKSGLCDYYTISKNPGTSQRVPVRSNKFAFLDDEKIKQALIVYKDEQQSHVSFYLPQMHCSSCLWLLENLYRLNPDIVSSKVNFTRKEAVIIFNHHSTSLKQVAELLASIGYEPYISFNDMKQAKPGYNRSKIYKMGVAGFCFANIMLLSFPEYLGIDAKEQNLVGVFRYLNLLLSLPVFFYSASEFYTSAWKSLKYGFLNIDAPIVLAIVVTFSRSIYEVFSASGGGYFDSMSGIVFFMLIGRVLRDKTYDQLSFERDYTSYFPIAVTRLDGESQEPVPLHDIRLDDTLLIHNQELVPADGILTRGSALIDYSFVTGESVPVQKNMGEIIYAGGKQIGSNIEIMVIKEVAQSYLTRLWNREELKQVRRDEERSFVHILGRFFTWIVLAIALTSGLYWYLQNDYDKVWGSVTAVLIIACPCALALCNTFTNGNVLGILARNNFYLRNAQKIEDIAEVDHIVFDKTGTLTTGQYQHVEYEGQPLNDDQKRKIALLAAQSSHPMSKAIVAYLAVPAKGKITGFDEQPGKGITGEIEGDKLIIGSGEYVFGKTQSDAESSVYVSIGGAALGRFRFKNHYRDNVPELVRQLKKRYHLSVLSGDNAGEKTYLQQLLGSDAEIHFHQKPEDKLETIKRLQQQGKKVMMVGDGLNDAGALKQADIGVAVAEDTNNFTPASDAIIEAERLPLLYRFIRMCKINKRIVIASFTVSILYNIVGNYYAVQGDLTPMIAAILMPCSSLSILLITFGASNVAGKYFKLK